MSPEWRKRTGGKKVVCFRFPSPEREWPVSYIKESRLRGARWVGQGSRVVRCRVWGRVGYGKQAGGDGTCRDKNRKNKI